MTSVSKNKVHASTGAALAYTNKKLDPSCTDCSDIPPVCAIILYPNLATPLILHSSEKILNFFIAAEGKSKVLFGINPASISYPLPAPLAYLYVDKHLRIYSINEKNLKEDTKDGRFWKDGKICAKAAQYVKVWCIGPLDKGVVKDITGKTVAHLRSKTVQEFNNRKSAYEDAADPLVQNSDLEWLYQIQIELENLPMKISEEEMVTLAWMIPMATRYRKERELQGIEDWEYQDKLIHDFLEAQKRSTEKNHVPDLYEFDVATASSSKFPKIKQRIPHRLKVWHPIIIKSKHSLKIGHLSDVHINSRQFSLAASDVQVIEGVSRRIGEKVDNCFVALKELLEKMKGAGADAIFITGDLLDFNRNLDPRQVVGSSPKDQWPIYNLLENIDDGKLYPRGLDDMLVFSLIRYCYEKLNLPVYVTTGNHEAYDVPYGLSPRANPFVMGSAIKQITSHTTAVVPARLRASILKGDHALKIARKTSDQIKSIPYLGPDWSNLVGGWEELLKKASKKMGVTTDPHDFKLFDTKMNDGIPADHNLTIYEACLVYGPSFPQVVKPFNFYPENFDWFFNLFTPLSDFRVDYQNQVLVGLDWGNSEIMVNLDVSGKELYNTPWNSAGIMGALMGLPRANESLNERQRNLIEEARRSHKRVMLFAHFTLINYDLPFSLSYKTPEFLPRDDIFNEFTKGTFSKGRDWLYPRLNNGIHYTLSGHSHRSGVYRLSMSESGTMSAKGYQPAECDKLSETVSLTYKDFFKASSTSRVVVSSCGGPIGVQNLKGELYGWNLMPPSGTLVNIDVDDPTELQRIVPTKYNGARPRFCVALDYVQVHCKKQVLAWIPTGNQGHYWMIIGNVLEIQHCITKATIYVWDDKSQNFAEFFCGVAPMPGHATLYNFHIADHAGFFKKALSRKSEDLHRKHVFIQVNFDHALAMNPLYSHYNFDDPWIFRIDVQSSEGPQPFITPAGERRAEIPDWEWVAMTNPSRYPKQETGLL